MIEKELFSNYSINEKKLLAYGFQPDGSTLVYAYELPEETTEEELLNLVKLQCGDQAEV